MLKEKIQQEFNDALRIAAEHEKRGPKDQKRAVLKKEAARLMAEGRLKDTAVSSVAGAVDKRSPCPRLFPTTPAPYELVKTSSGRQNLKRSPPALRRKRPSLFVSLGQADVCQAIQQAAGLQRMMPFLDPVTIKPGD